MSSFILSPDQSEKIQRLENTIARLRSYIHWTTSPNQICFAPWEKKQRFEEYTKIMENVPDEEPWMLPRFRSRLYLLKKHTSRFSELML